MLVVWKGGMVVGGKLSKFKMMIQDEDSRWRFKMRIQVDTQDEGSRWRFKMRIQVEDSRRGFKLTLGMIIQDKDSRWGLKMRIQDEDSRWGFKLTLRMKSQDENSRWGFKLENTMRIQIDIHDENWRWRFEMRIQDEAEASSHTHISITRNTTKRATDISRIRSGFLTTLSRNLQRIKSMNLCWHVPVLFKYLNQCKVNNGIGNRSQGRILAGDQ